MGRDLAALLLVGGYARGEGGLVSGDRGLLPYNDLDLVAIVHGGASRWRRRLAALGGSLRGHVGVDVDIWAVSTGLLGRPPRTLFWLDVALGGFRVLSGDPTLLGSVRLDCRSVPTEEAARLLANRAVGLALSNLEPSPPDATRPLRHAHKAVLACGDALLLSVDRYQPTVRLRAREMGRLASVLRRHAPLAAAYREAARFRLRPDLWRAPCDPEIWYRDRLRDVARWHLEFEAWRVGTPEDPLAYASAAQPIYSQLADVPPGGRWAAAARGYLRGAAPPGTWHPRERLARVAVLLAYARHDPRAEVAARGLLGLPAASPDARTRSALAHLAEVGG